MYDYDMEIIINAAPNNQLIQNTLMKMDLKLQHYKNPVCSISGGSDSDTMLDIIERVRGDRPVTYVFFDTGIEYEATKRHLDELEAKYGVEIIRRDAVVPVPLGCKRCGLPFLTKQASDFLGRLQAHGFQWEDEPLDVLSKRYPGTRTALRFWCNEDISADRFGIANFSYLKEFIISNPPNFKISDKCCQGAKKDTGALIDTEFQADIKILGLRQAEGGVRATAFSSCFSLNKKGFGNYRPLWFWSDADKAEYKEFYRLAYSNCYEVWGFKRTGCAGCPFNSRFEDDLKTMEQYEPKLYKAANNIFVQSYEYTRAYRKFKEERKQEKKLNGQTVLY